MKHNQLIVTKCDQCGARCLPTLVDGRYLCDTCHEAQQAEASCAASIVCITAACQRASMHGSLYCAEHRSEYE